MRRIPNRGAADLKVHQGDKVLHPRACGHQNVFSVNETQNKAMRLRGCRAERYLSKAQQKRHLAVQELNKSQHQVSDLQPARHLMPLQQTRRRQPPHLKGKENPYAKPRVGKCYKCDEPGHRSNECPKKKSVNMADYEDKDEVLIDNELEDSDFVEEGREAATCVIQRLLCNQKIPTPHKGIKFSTQGVR